MEHIDTDRLTQALEKWKGKDVFLHFEITPGGYYRNGRARLDDVHVKGTGPYRVFLELDQQQAILHVDDLTHMLVEQGQVIITAYDSHNRLARTLEVSTQPFQIEWNGNHAGTAER